MNDSRALLSRQDALAAVYRALDSVNELRPAQQQLTKSPDLILFGVDSTLDSLAFTTLVLATERNVEDLTGVATELLAAAGSDASALRTVGALVEVILQRLAE